MTTLIIACLAVTLVAVSGYAIGARHRRGPCIDRSIDVLIEALLAMPPHDTHTEHNPG